MTGFTPFLTSLIRIFKRKNIYKRFRKGVKPVKTRHSKIMDKINFKTISGDELLAMERKAWDGVLEYEDLPAPEYKFFDTIRRLGEQCRFNKVPAELLKDDIAAARKVYRRERGELQYGLDINTKYQDAIMKSDALKIAVEKAVTVEDKLRFALECIGLLTDETEFAVRNLRKVGLT